MLLELYCPTNMYTNGECGRGRHGLSVDLYARSVSITKVFSCPEGFPRARGSRALFIWLIWPMVFEINLLILRAWIFKNGNPSAFSISLQAAYRSTGDTGGRAHGHETNIIRNFLPRSNSRKFGQFPKMFGLVKRLGTSKVYEDVGKSI